MEIVYTISVSTTFFILGILATYFFGLRKILRCIVVPSMSLVDISQDVQNKTKIFYNGKMVENLSSTTLKIRNSSFFHITDNHFADKLKIIFNKPVEILEYEILEESHPGRKTDIEFKKNIATIKKLTLLNKFEYLVIRFIHQGVSNATLPTIKADLHGFKIRQEEGMLKGKRESNLMLGEGILNTFMGLSAGLFGVLLLNALLMVGNWKTLSNYFSVFLSLIFCLLSVFMLFSGIKKLYIYFTRVIELKPGEDKKNE